MSFESFQGGQHDDMMTILISEQNNFDNSKSPCGPNASHQVLAQSDLGFRSKCGFRSFKMEAQGAI